MLAATMILAAVVPLTAFSAVGAVAPASGIVLSASGAVLPDEAPVHLGVAMRLQNAEALQQLLAAQQDPRSPSYHAWLDPQAFGDWFGLAEADYEAIVSWFTARGFQVKRYPNRLFLEATGGVASVRSALGVQLRWGQEKQGRLFRTFNESLTLPDSLAAHVLHISGLDTRNRLRHRPTPHIAVSGEGDGLGAADLRLEYDMSQLMSGGQAAAGLTTAILGTQEGTASGRRSESVGPPYIPPSTTAIQTYFQSISNATATYNPIALTNSNDDFDTPGSNQEYQLDVEMQSVGAANATDIDLILSPASEVFTTGAQYIANMTNPSPVVVSTSLGLCEPEEAQYNGGSPTTTGSEMQVLQQTVQQGLAAGQAWFVAAGDTGADDCNDSASGTSNGFNGGNATVDFPGTLPEFVDMGGTQFAGTGSWDSSGNLTAYEVEDAWNEGAQGGAGGGGQSLYYAKPAYQQGVGPSANDGARDVPDFSLSAATGTPGVAIYACGSGQQEASCGSDTSGAGTLELYGGTSIAAPLAAGIFAALSGKIGCRLGDIHNTLYAFGGAQLDGGTQVFHDVTSGNNSFPDPKNTTITGFTAGPGYDLATGWGSLDVDLLAANWPACNVVSGTTGTTGTGPTTSSTSTSGTSASTTTSSSSSSSSTSAGSTTARLTSTSSSGTSSSGTSTGGHSTTTASSTGTTSSTSAGTSGATTGGVGTTGSGTGGGGGGGCSCATTPGEGLAFWLPVVIAVFASRRRRRSAV